MPRPAVRPQRPHRPRLRRATAAAAAAGRRRPAAAPDSSPLDRRGQDQRRRYRLDADLHRAGADDVVPGLALFYGGMVRKKNVLATLMQSFAITCLVTILWWLIGYSWAFTPGSGFIGRLEPRALQRHELHRTTPTTSSAVSHLALTIPETVYAMFQMTFAIITPALIAGAFADRMKFSAMLVFMAAWSLLVYAPIAHMVWEPTGWLNAAGVLDFAGGTVVHINAGIAGLASCLVLGKRLGYGREAMPPHNLTLTLIGASLLWVGWFGFNAGSAGAADGRAGMAMLATQMATGGCRAWRGCSPSGSARASRACSASPRARWRAWSPSRRPPASWVRPRP